MVNELLVNLVNSVLGTGKRTARGNQAYTCPFCHHHKPKLEVNFTENNQGNNPWQCWVCGKRGKTIKSLFKQVQVDATYFQELGKLVKNVTIENTEIVHSILELPKEFKTFIHNKDLTARHALAYLKKRNISNQDILKYNIGYCDSGPYNNMIVIPSYDNSGKLNYFTARSFEKDPFTKYRNPETSRDIIPFELFINWNLPLVNCATVIGWIKSCIFRDCANSCNAFSSKSFLGFLGLTIIFVNAILLIAIAFSMAAG